MKQIQATFPTPGAMALSALLGLSACAGMSQRDRDTAIGAGIGGLAGSVLTEGSAIGTVGGAAIGGYIGNQLERNKRRGR